MSSPITNVPAIASIARSTAVENEFPAGKAPVTNVTAKITSESVAAIRRGIKSIRYLVRRPWSVVRCRVLITNNGQLTTDCFLYLLNHLLIRLKNPPASTGPPTPRSNRAASCPIAILAGQRGFASTNGIRLRTAIGTFSSDGK